MRSTILKTQRRHAQGSVLARALHRAGRLPRSLRPRYLPAVPGKEVRLRYGYFITAQSVVKNAEGEVVEVHCTYDPATRGGNAPDGRKVKSTIHWVSAAHAIDAEVRIYETLFTKADPNDVEEGRLHGNLNPNSLEIVPHAKLEPSLASAEAGEPLPVRASGIFLRG